MFFKYNTSAVNIEQAFRGKATCRCFAVRDLQVWEINKAMSNKAKQKIQFFFKKLSGGNRQQEEIDTLYYFLNEYADITKAGPTKDPDLRKLQLCNTELLAIFDAVCARHGLTYWLDYGTALGCVRHGGFIPWDDDVDACMPREDYDRLMELTKDEMAGYGIIVRSGGYYDDRGPMERLAFAYKTLETGGWLDIFPVDHVATSQKAAEIRDGIASVCDRYSAIYRKHHRSWSDEKFVQIREQMFSQFPAGENKIYFHGQEFEGCNDFIMDENDIFPLKRMPFESYEFCVPKNYDLFLRGEYGDDYMSFPRKGVEHHLDPDGGRASERARKTGTDMEAEIAALHEVLKKVEE